MFSRRPSLAPNDQPTMRAIAITDGKLHPVSVPMPSLATDEVLIKVSYAGINRADLFQVAGSYAPPAGASPLPGLEVSGTIATLGTAVKGWSVGEEICALLSGGGYAEYVAVPAAQLLSVPARLSLMQAASLPEAATTAYMALAMEAKLQAGERVLLHGGASGVGIIMAQVARAWGAEVYATVGSAEKAALLSQLHIHPINHATEDFVAALGQATNNEGVDVIIDTLGAPYFDRHLQLLRKNGRLVSLALLEGNVAESVRLGRILTRQLRISGATLRSRTAAEKEMMIAGVHKTIWPHLSTGAIQPVTDQIFPLEQAEKAHARMQERLHIGKILLEVAPETGH